MVAFAWCSVGCTFGNHNDFFLPSARLPSSCRLNVPLCALIGAWSVRMPHIHAKPLKTWQPIVQEPWLHQLARASFGVLALDYTPSLSAWSRLKKLRLGRRTGTTLFQPGFNCMDIALWYAVYAKERGNVLPEQHCRPHFRREVYHIYRVPA
ncbi:hypothetical protein BJ508DRAFT_158166 [Ascobolus immersus RN42]|uniref:Uncharacterized protein n=1 Tax=Ascobolus immersus RN42 TaxID=1160509 RepID=A0A3N4III9_ASCIM|nr:hypothetical protein BJ508DRAFT_158166 [Ascobolus immersus RN42]